MLFPSEREAVKAIELLQSIISKVYWPLQAKYILAQKTGYITIPWGEELRA